MNPDTPAMNRQQTLSGISVKALPVFAALSGVSVHGIATMWYFALQDWTGEGCQATLTMQE